jgi:multiple sugar transport system substrate-binding protein
MMRRSVLVLVLVLVAAGLFATAESEGADGSAKTVELTVAFPRDNEENEYRIEAELDRVARFEAAYPNISVTPVYVEYDNTGEFFVRQAAGQAPAVITVWATEAQLFVDRGWGVALDDYLANWDKRDWYNPDAFLPFTVGGTIYGVPDNNYVKHVIYNKALFAAAGVPEPSLDWTWDDFTAAAVATTDTANGVAGFAPMGRGAESGWGFSDMIYQAGAEVIEDRDGVYTAVFDSAEAIAAAQFLKDLKWRYEVIPANWSNGWGDVFNVFGALQAAMVYDADWGRNIAINSLGMDPGNIGVVPMPKGPGPNGRQAGVLGGTYWVINGPAARTKDVQDAAWLWIDFERYDEAGLDRLQSEIADARANGQYRAQFVYSPLLPGAEYILREQEILRGNSDAAVLWGSEAFLEFLPGTAHTEPVIAAQELYGQYLANVVQILFSEEDADPSEVMTEMNARFQAEILDPLNAAR